MKLSVKLWPIGGGVRDAAQARFVAAFVGRVGRQWRVTLEAPVPLPGDLRAVDVVLNRGEIGSRSRSSLASPTSRPRCERLS